MLGLALIAALILWIIVIVLSVWLPQKIFKANPKVANIVSIIGFMLSCGFWVAKWNIESIAAQKEAREMCKQAGVTIYVQPEKWKEMVGGEEAWKKLGYNEAKSWYSLINDEKKEVSKALDIQGIQYEFGDMHNNRVLSYRYSQFGANWFFSSRVYVDKVTGQVLFKITSLTQRNLNLDSGFKVFFQPKIKECDFRKERSQTMNSFFYITSQYY